MVSNLPTNTQTFIINKRKEIIIFGINSICLSSTKGKWIKSEWMHSSPKKNQVEEVIFKDLEWVLSNRLHLICRSFLKRFFSKLLGQIIFQTWLNFFPGSKNFCSIVSSHLFFIQNNERHLKDDLSRAAEFREMLPLQRIQKIISILKKSWNMTGSRRVILRGP